MKEFQKLFCKFLEMKKVIFCEYICLVMAKKLNKKINF